jgi:hypothetical protein
MVSTKRRGTPRSRAFSSPFKTPFAKKSPEYRRKIIKQVFDMVKDGRLIPEKPQNK